MEHLREWKEKLGGRKFVRFGKMGMVKQKGYGKDTFHAPPAAGGFYAFPYRFQELFLVGSLDKLQPGQLGMPKSDKFKDPETGEVDWDAYDKKRKERYSAIRHEFTIDHTTEFWHHLPVPNSEVSARHGSWVKTNFRAWEKAVKKESVKLRAESLGIFDEKSSAGKKMHRPGGINSVGKRTGLFSKNNFEVFFDTKIA